MQDKEQKIIDERIKEAIREGLMGPSGKLGCIVRFLGEPIISQNSGGVFFDTNYLDDPWEIIDEEADPFQLKGETPEEITNEIPTHEPDLQYPGIPNREPSSSEWTQRPEGNYYNIDLIGWFFDGTSKGMHLEIKYIENSSELTVSYKGHLVYKEMAGDLRAFRPLKEWNDMIKRLHPLARAKERQYGEQEKVANRAKAEKKKKEWLAKMRRKWDF